MNIRQAINETENNSGTRRNFFIGPYTSFSSFILCISIAGCFNGSVFRYALNTQKILRSNPGT